MKRSTILDLTKGLVDRDLLLKTQTMQPIKHRKRIRKNIQPSSLEPFETITQEVAMILQEDEHDLSHWMKASSAPNEILTSLLKVARRLRLNPLLTQIAIEYLEETGWEVYIPIDGWIALIHREPTFHGITFNQSIEMADGIPLWMECSIYRTNLARPITVREYFCELKTDHPMWQGMPYRMLRHKTVQQCARLAFGITLPQLTTPKTHAHMNQPTISLTPQETPNQKLRLKQKLTAN